MQQRAILSSQPVEQSEEITTVKIASQPVELTEAQLLQVAGGLLGPNGGWDSATAGPNGGW
jgi:hypothetical protein